MRHFHLQSHNSVERHYTLCETYQEALLSSVELLRLLSMFTLFRPEPIHRPDDSELA